MEMANQKDLTGNEFDLQSITRTKKNSSVEITELLFFETLGIILSV